MTGKSKEPVRLALPRDPTAAEIGYVDRWLSENDDRPLIEQIRALWYHATTEEKDEVKWWQ